MITVAYTVGATVLGNAGAAIRNAPVIESLAQVTVLCFGKTSTLRGADVEIEMMSPPSGYPGLAENRVRQLLGTYARSTRADNTYLRAMARGFGGEGRVVEQEAPYLSAFGWSGITFSEPDIRGTYILGDPDLLNDQLASSDRPAHEVEPATATAPFWRRAWDRSTIWIKRMTGPGETQASEAHEIEPDASRLPTRKPLASENDPVEFGAVPGTPGLWGRLRTQLGGVFEHLEDMLGTEEAQPEAPPGAQSRLLFAYSPGPQALFDTDGWPQMPSALVPICTLTFNQQVRPEARQAVRAFTDAGVQVKLFTTDAPEVALATVGQLGIGEGRQEPGQVVSGAELTGTSEGAFAQSAQRGTIFASITPEQKAELVRVLRSQGEHVALVSDSVHDVPAMHQANVSIAFRSSSRAVLDTADIVLLEDSLQVLPTVLAEGQRIFNSLLNTLKLNLTQVSYLLLLQIVALVVGRYVFFYQPRHAGLVSLFTLTLPGLALPFWSAAVAVPGTRLRPQLVHFVLPSALTVTAAVVSIDYLFLRAGADVTYTQLAVALAVIAMGLTLFVYVQPWVWESVGGNVLSGNWRFIWLAIGLFIAYLALSSFPLAQELLKVGLLSRVVDYAVVGLVVLLWALALRAIWRTRLLNRFADIVSGSKRESRIATVVRHICS